MKRAGTVGDPMEPVICPTIKRRTLAILLQKLQPLPRVEVALEQYPTPADVAADVLFKAYGQRDVHDRAVADLGCGNGVLALGAARLGASRVVGIDADPHAVEVARRNAEALGLDVAFHALDVGAFDEEVDTVVMNPPFGGQKRHADVPFLETAIRTGSVAYSFHNAATRAFVLQRVGELGGRARVVGSYRFPLAHAQPFHRKEVAWVDVDLFHIVREN